MRILLISLLSFFTLQSIVWQIDIKIAKEKANQDHKFILLNFSGSDWCGPCIRLHREIFNNETFSNYASQHLVLVNADFPRLKKNQLSKEQQKKNDEMADTYNKDGVFPLTLLLNSEGKVLKKWDGFPNVSVDEFIGEINTLTDANK